MWGKRGESTPTFVWEGWFQARSISSENLHGYDKYVIPGGDHTAELVYFVLLLRKTDK